MKSVLLAMMTVVFFATSFYTKENKRTVESATSTVPKKTNTVPTESEKTAVTAAEVYSEINFANVKELNAEIFDKAYRGFMNLKAAGKLPAEAHLLTVCDFSLSSTEKRLWVIDLENKTVLFNSLVAHGKNTGDEFATRFSNTESSLQSSLGFYVTDVTYNGNNGYSLRLHGMDAGYNDAALQRAVVMHGADYVSEDFIRAHKRIGRSWGCPAVPRALAEPIINTIKGKNCLFIYYPDSQYLSASKWLNSGEMV